MLEARWTLLYRAIGNELFRCVIDILNIKHAYVYVFFTETYMYRSSLLKLEIINISVWKSALFQVKKLYGTCCCDDNFKYT